ncbi:MAG: hypothetical protein PVI75_02955 [Gammaproteobacteria bacterium]|jgi:hypothetical protein
MKKSIRYGKSGSLGKDFAWMFHYQHVPGPVRLFSRNALWKKASRAKKFRSIRGILEMIGLKRRS